MRTRHPRQTNTGFTLLELMVGIVIVAILAGLALPSMTNLILKHRVQDAATDMFTTLFKARSEALRRVQTVSVKPSSGSGSNWLGDGWSILDNANNVLDTHQPLQRMTITTTPASLTAINYNASGRASCAPACANGPTFVFLASSGSYSCSYTVSIDPTGRPYETATRGSNTQVAGGGVPTC